MKWSASTSPLPRCPSSPTRLPLYACHAAEPPAIPVADPPQPKASRVKALPVPPVSELLEAVARPNPAPGAGPVQEAAKSEN